MTSRRLTGSYVICGLFCMLTYSRCMRANVVEEIPGRRTRTHTTAHVTEVNACASGPAPFKHVLFKGPLESRYQWW